MKRLLSQTMVILLAAASMAAFSYTVRLNYFDVQRQNNDFLLTWQAEVEEDVQVYEVYRKTAFATDYTLVKKVPPHGVRKQYQLLDNQVYKVLTEQLDYRLDAVFTNGLRQQVAERKINYTPTAVRRTWGSIKAMFQ